MPLRNILQNCALLAASLIIALLLAEILVRYLTHFPIHSAVSNRVFDEHLLYRMDRNVSGIDQNGFRNPEGYDKDFPRIATIGDSHTYGVNVRRAGSWPGQIEAIVGARVYNFGVGSYNLLQYAETMRMAAERGARTILVAVYSQNDIDFCQTARLRYWLDGYFNDETLRTQLKTYCNHSDRQLNNTPQQIMKIDNDERLRLASRSALYSLVRYVADFAVPRRDNLSRVLLPFHGGRGNDLGRCAKSGEDFTFEINGYSDFVPSQFQHFANFRNKIWQNKVFLDDFLDRLLEQMATDAGRVDAQMLIAMVPTRLRVVHSFLTTPKGRGTNMPAWVEEAAAAEADITDYLTNAVRRHGIPVVDVTEAVTTAYGLAVENGEVFYPCKDDHPLEAGYRAYAEAMAPQVWKLVAQAKSAVPKSR